MTPELTPSERAVLEARCEGEALKDIALRLGRSIPTVAEWERRALIKIGVPQGTTRHRRLEEGKRIWGRMVRDEAVRAATS